MLRRSAGRWFRSVGPISLEHGVIPPSHQQVELLANACLAHKVHRSPTTRSLGGSSLAAIFSASGLGLFAFTFGYNVGKPVYDAYTREDSDDGDDDDDDE